MVGWFGRCCYSSHRPRFERTPDSDGPMKITATIITLNEERNIARAIESLRCCDQIVVLDSGSVDRTVELAAKLGAVVLEDSWRGYANRRTSSPSTPGM